MKRICAILAFMVLAQVGRAQVYNMSMTYTGTGAELSAAGTGSVTLLGWNKTTSKYKYGLVSNFTSKTGTWFPAYRIQVGGGTASSDNNTRAGAAVVELSAATAYTVTQSMADSVYRYGTPLNFTTPAAPVTEKSVILNITNNFKVPARFKVYQDGQVIREMILEAGARVSFGVTVYTNSIVTVTQTPIGYTRNPTTGDYAATATGGTDTETTYSTTDPQTFSGTPNQTPVNGNPPPDNFASKGAVSDGANTYGTSSAPTFQNTTTGALDSPTFKEGVTILDAKLAAINTTLRSIDSKTVVSSSSSSSSTSVDFTATNAKLDAIKASIDLQKTDRTSEVTAAGTSQTTLLGTLGDGASAKETAGRALVNKPSGSVPALSASGSPGGAFWKFSLGGHEFDANPLSNSTVASLFVFSKSLFTWCIALALIVGLLKNNDWLVQGTSSAQTTTAAPVTILGTGTGVPAALIKAALATTLIFASVPLSYAVFTDSLSGVSLVGQLFANPLNAASTAAGGATFFSEGIKLLNAAIPVDFSVLSLVTYILHKFSCQALTMGIASGLRWIAG